ncbi:nuclear transport factor 2 family protein [Actinocorallia populi]|uniref:nuclear transport factor 2 family protein n=1 Tax=Actinocorallia populi TaxID=2079200 RepID=UPI000D08AD01|nr:nuclear transport factor 2 family protein [Actinocorallia populi]
MQTSRSLQPLAALLLTAAGAALLYLGRAEEPRDRALLDAAATGQVLDEVGDGLTRVLSYSPDGLDLTEDAARDVLRGRAAEQYRTLFARVREEAPAQGTSMRTRVVRAGAVELTGDHAVVLVFLDQTSVREGGRESRPAAAQLTVTARYEDGRWRITELKAT